MTPWRTETLRKTLHRIGFRWKKCGIKGKILIERADIIRWCSKYLIAIRKLHSEDNEIFYLDESWVDSNLTFKRCWQSEEVAGVCSDGNVAKRLIIINVGS